MFVIFPKSSMLDDDRFIFDVSLSFKFYFGCIYLCLNNDFRTRAQFPKAHIEQISINRSANVNITFCDKHDNWNFRSHRRKIKSFF